MEEGALADITFMDEATLCCREYVGVVNQDATNTVGEETLSYKLRKERDRNMNCIVRMGC